MAIELKGEIYVTPKEAVTVSGRAKQTIYQHHKKWGWTAYQFGPNILFKQSEIHKWLESQILVK